FSLAICMTGTRISALLVAFTQQSNSQPTTPKPTLQSMYQLQTVPHPQLCTQNISEAPNGHHKASK
ncbi:hypothetical protein, partial [Bartonella bovis]|uniref:hypothetical protein n=1 Tax=Bartonella bovis TaxID=155194 RepID=UPI00195C4F3F